LLASVKTLCAYNRMDAAEKWIREVQPRTMMDKERKFFDLSKEAAANCPKNMTNS